MDIASAIMPGKKGVCVKKFKRDITVVFLDQKHQPIEKGAHERCANIALDVPTNYRLEKSWLPSLEDKDGVITIRVQCIVDEL